MLMTNKPVFNRKIENGNAVRRDCVFCFLDTVLFFIPLMNAIFTTDGRICITVL